MKDLILITAFCNTQEKENTLRNLVSQINKRKDFFDVLLVSHTPIPLDIQDKCDYSLYDSKNELLYDWDLRSKPWFDPNNERPILSIFTGFFNTHLTCYRMIILGNSIAKNMGYNKVHYLEYDCIINDFSELITNSKLLDQYDCVSYNKSGGTVDDISFGSYYAYNLNTLTPNLVNLDENNIKKLIRESLDKSPEGMFFSWLHTGKKGLVKPKSLLDKEENIFGCSHLINKSHTAWCLPFFDILTNKLSFIIWNAEREEEIEVSLIYNNEKYINLGKTKPMNWRMEVIDDFKNAKNMIVILDGKIRNSFDFEKDGENFKQVSFREMKKR